jgi:hypothetical protein
MPLQGRKGKESKKHGALCLLTCEVPPKWRLTGFAWVSTNAVFVQGVKALLSKGEEVV